MLLSRGLSLSMSPYYSLLAGNLRTPCHEMMSVLIKFFLGASQALLKTIIHNKSLNNCKHFMVSKWMGHKFSQKVFHIYFTIWFTHSKASLWLFNSREKPLYDNILLVKIKNINEKSYIYIPAQEWLDSREHSRQVNVLNSLELFRT